MTALEFPDLDYTARLDAARHAMGAANVGVLALSVGSDLAYLTGYEAMANERITMVVIDAGGAVLFVPRLEEPRVAPRPDAFMIETWDETDDPLERIAARMGRASTVAVGSQTWSRFLIGLQLRLPEARFIDAGPIMRRLRAVKDDDEIALLRAAGRAVDRVLAELPGARFAGRTERAVAVEIAAATIAAGHQVASFTIVASGPNSASPHHEPGDRVIASGDSLVIDFGGRHHGYASDVTRTFHVGSPDAGFVEAYEVLRRAQQAGVEAAVPGAAAQDVDRAARRVIEDAGYGRYFIHRTGHGIGLDVHEDPYLVEGNDEVLRAGMAFSVEPGIYVPGRYGMRIEDIVTLVPDGPQRLNQAPRELVIVE